MQKPAQNIKLEKQFGSTPSTEKVWYFYVKDDTMRKLSGLGAKSEMWILHTEIQDGVQDGRQYTNFDNIPYKSGKIAIKCILFIISHWVAIRKHNTPLKYNYW